MAESREGKIAMTNPDRESVERLAKKVHRDCCEAIGIPAGLPLALDKRIAQYILTHYVPVEDLKELRADNVKLAKTELEHENLIEVMQQRIKESVPVEVVDKLVDAVKFVKIHSEVDPNQWPKYVHESLNEALAAHQSWKQREEKQL